MDGVLADFDRHHVNVMGFAPDWTSDQWKYHKRFHFSEIPQMQDMRTLWDYVSKYDPIVLTGLPKTDPDRAWGEKRRWLDRRLGSNTPMIGCMSKDKNRYSRPGDILIDDRAEYSHLWEAVGGVWITHTSARSTIETLKGMGL